MGHKGVLSLEFSFWLSAAMLISYAVGEKVQCNYVKAAEESFNKAVCKCARSSNGDSPWHKERVAPASFPDNCSVTFNTKGEIHALVRWVYRSSSLQDIKGGFYLELVAALKDDFTDYRYKCDVDTKKINSTNEKEVEFGFDNCCAPLENGIGWKAVEELTVTVHALPMYNFDDKAYFANCVGKIPNNPPIRGKRTRLQRKPRHCKNCKKCGSSKRKKCHLKNRHPKNKRRNTPESVPEIEAEVPLGTNANLMVALACVSTVLCITLLLSMIAIAYWLTRVGERRRLQGVDRSLYVIGDSDCKCVPVVNQVVKIVKKCGLPRTRVATNVRELTEIARTGITQWITSKMSDADIVIFVITEVQLDQSPMQSTTENRNSPHVKIALSIAECMALRNGYHTSKNKFIVLDINGFTSSKSLPFCTLYTLRKDFRKFVKHALGLHYHTSASDIDVTALLKLSCFEESFQMGNGTQITRTIQVCNDLNHSVLYSPAKQSMLEKPMQTPNIAQDQLPSVENNEVR